MNTHSDARAFANRSNFRAIILGASDWPHVESLENSDAFTRSKTAFLTYLKETLSMTDDAILDLFDQDHSNVEVNKEISNFLEANEKNGAPNYTHLIIYYTGHGDFTSDQNFQLILRSTDGEQKDWTGYQMRMLSEAISKKAGNATKLVILDCCYAAASFKDWQLQNDGDLAVKIEKEAENHFTSSSGTALLCACSEDEWALLRKDDPDALTMFSGGLMNALREGDADLGAMLSIENLEQLAKDFIQDAHGQTAVRPILHIAKGRREEIATQLLFPNPARDQIESDTRFAELEASLAMLQAEIQQNRLTIKADFDDAITNIQNMPGVGPVDSESSPGGYLGLRMAEWKKLEPGLQSRLLDVIDAQQFSLRLWISAATVFTLNLSAIALMHEPSIKLSLSEIKTTQILGVLFTFNLMALVILLLFCLAGAAQFYLPQANRKTDGEIEDNPIVLRALSKRLCRVFGVKYLFASALGAFAIALFSAIASIITIDGMFVVYRIFLGMIIYPSAPSPTASF